MKIEWQAVIPAVLAIWYFVKRWIGEIDKIIEPLAKEAEKLALDKIIDKADRKALVMKAISILEKDGKIKLNFISRMIISFLVDKIAARLPDFKITQEANNVISEVAKK